MENCIKADFSIKISQFKNISVEFDNLYQNKIHLMAQRPTTQNTCWHWCDPVVM